MEDSNCSQNLAHVFTSPAKDPSFSGGSFIEFVPGGRAVAGADGNSDTLRFAADEASLLPFSCLAFRSARLADSMYPSQASTSAVYSLSSRRSWIVIKSNQLIQRFLEPASVVLVIVEGVVTCELVDGSNKPGRLVPLCSALSLQLLHFRVRHTDLLQHTRVHNNVVFFRGCSNLIICMGSIT